MPMLAPLSAWSEAMACAAASSAGARSEIALGAGVASGRPSCDTRMTATPMASQYGKRRCMRVPASRSLRAVWEAAVFVALAAGCTRHARVAEPRPLEMLVANDPETLDPRYVTDSVGLRATRLVHAGLVRLDPDTLAPIADVAPGWR